MAANTYTKAAGNPGAAPKRRKIGVVMSEFKAGNLKSGGGGVVKDRNQAIAIALSEAKRAGQFMFK